jgi:hypothetical protein
MPVARESPLPLRWVALLVFSAAFTALLEWLGLPAALLLGPMAGGIALAGAEAAVEVPRLAFLFGQAVVGCLMADAITPDIVGTLGRNWPLFGAAVLAVVVVSAALGVLMHLFRLLPGSTAIWGTSPGAATAMTLMAEAGGADMRLVAFMQYLRVVLVAVVASGVARFVGAGGGVIASTVWFPPLAAGPLAVTVGLAAFAAAGGSLLRSAAGPMLIAFGVGGVLHAGGWISIGLPPWLLAASYAMVGWTIGLRFNRGILLHAAHLLPRILASTLLLIAACGGLGVLLGRLGHIDPLTAYLAMSPGGADSIAIIAASTHADMPFVMALQTARFVLVMATGPALARLLTRRFHR